MRAVILAGGKGTRLKPYTTVIPKPLLPLGDKPILEIVLAQLKNSGFRHITLTVGHLAGLIKAFFGDGSHLGLSIDYVIEEKPLGTAGGLALVKGLKDSFLVMNGDILTTLPFEALIETHRKESALATIAVKEERVSIDYGTLETDGNNGIVAYREKPSIPYLVSMGIYVFHEKVFRFIKPGERLDVPELVDRILVHREKAMVFRSQDYWLDIGRPGDYEKAIEDYLKDSQRFLSDAKT